MNNQYTPGAEVLAKTGFNIESHGSVASTAPYLFNNDVPDYATMFYHPTEHEMFSSIKYGNFEMAYDNLKDMREDLIGPPMEFYVPQETTMSGNFGKQDTSDVTEILKDKLLTALHKEATDEIEKAQQQIKSRRITVEVEDTLIVRKRKKKLILQQDF